MEVPRFWRETRARYNLEGVRCGACETVYFPPREVCPDCHRESIGKMEKYKLSLHILVNPNTVLEDVEEKLRISERYVNHLYSQNVRMYNKLTAVKTVVGSEEIEPVEKV